MMMMNTNITIVVICYKVEQQGAFHGFIAAPT